MRRRAVAVALVVAAAVLAGCDHSDGSHRDGPDWGDRAVTPSVQTPDHPGVGAGGGGQ